MPAEPEFEEFTDATTVWPGERPNNARQSPKGKKGGRSPKGSPKVSPKGSPKGSRTTTPVVSAQSSAASLEPEPEPDPDPLEGMSPHDMQEELVRRGLAANIKEAKRVPPEEVEAMLRAAIEQDIMLAYCFKLAATDLPDRAYAEGRDRLIERLKVPYAVRRSVEHAQTDAGYAFIQIDPVPPAPSNWGVDDDDEPLVSQLDSMGRWSIPIRKARCAPRPCKSRLQPPPAPPTAGGLLTPLLCLPGVP